MIYDFIVVGSGSGGGALSYYLNKSGAKVLLIEAGHFYRKDTFPKTEAETSAHLYWGGGIEFGKDGKMGFLRTKMVGGSSIVYQCLMDRFDDIAFNDWKNESGVEWFNNAEMDKHYNQVESDMVLHTFAPEERNGNAKLFVEACDKLGYKWGNLRRGQSNCGAEKGNDCIGCLGGCFRDSKQSSLVAFIQKAEKEGLEIITETEINKVEPGKDTCKIYGLQNGNRVSFEGKKVILSGGAFGTTRMMTLSGFKSKFPALGKKFASHPQFMWLGFQNEPVDAHKKMFQAVASKDDSFRAQGFKLENVFASPISIGMLMNETGAEHQRLMKQYRYMQCIEVAVRDENVGEIMCDNKGKLTIVKPLTDQDKTRRNKGLQAIENILTTAGAKEIYKSNFYFGLHLMGGCVMGTDASKSVVNPEFQVHGEKTLYIADSSIYPNAPGINPGLTIKSLGHRLAMQLLK
ncbi:MAG TPA: GMC family oxidoreductase [Chitinophagales bacterium]|nr:GMC family oxidoreductase [Chitinophagales bacterium]